MNNTLLRIIVGIWLVAFVTTAACAIIMDARAFPGAWWMNALVTVSMAPIAVACLCIASCVVGGLCDTVSWICTGKSRIEA